MPLKTVKVPAQFEELFNQAEYYVENYFKDLKLFPTRGVIEIQGERYILVRAASMSIHFLQFIQNMYPSLNEEESHEASAKVLFDMAHVIGKSDAKNFHQKTQVTDQVAKLSTGPIHFSYTGWAFVDIFPESNPVPDESYYTVYDHPQSFEADSWLSQNQKTIHCTCHMNAGYSSGWCEESFGLPLVAREILCRAKGDQFCRFVMAQPHKLEEFIQKYKFEHPELFK